MIACTQIIFDREVIGSLSCEMGPETGGSIHQGSLKSLERRKMSKISSKINEYPEESVMKRRNVDLMPSNFQWKNFMAILPRDLVLSKRPNFQKKQTNKSIKIIAQNRSLDLYKFYNYCYQQAPIKTQ